MNTAKKSTRHDVIEVVSSSSKEEVSGVKLIEQTFFTAGSAGFVGIALFQLIAAFYATVALQDSSKAFGNALGTTTCFIAGYHYSWMREQQGQCRSLVVTRFSDWYITTNLMLLEFFVLSETLTQKYAWLVASCIACTLMLVSGHCATVQKEGARSYRQMYRVSIVFGVVLTALFMKGTLRDDTPHPSSWMYVFASFWIGYPFAFFDPTSISYSLLDLASKGVFGIVLGTMTFVS